MDASLESDTYCVCNHRSPCVLADKSYREAPGKSSHHGCCVADRRHRDVDCGHNQCALGGGWPRCAKKSHSHLEYGGDESGPGPLDRRLSNFIRGVSRDLTFDGHDCGWAIGGHVSGFSAGVLVFPVHSHHGGRHWIRFIEIATPFRGQSDWNRQH